MYWSPPSVEPQSAATLSTLVLAELAQGTDWLGTWWPALALGAAGLAAGVSHFRHARRTWPMAACAIVLLAAGATTGANAATGYVPSVGAAVFLLTHPASGARGPGSEVTGEAIGAPIRLGVPASTTWVYTPPGYDPTATARYPVVYLIHGTPGRSSDWFTAGDVTHVMDVMIAHHLVQPMIVVAPQVNSDGFDDTACLDSTRGGPQVETYLDDVVVPWIDAHYRTAADWRHRVIGGMSSGGYCALDQGLRHPELFGAIIALEPYDNPGSAGRTMLRTQAQYDAHAPGVYLRSMTFQHDVPTFLDVGQDSHRDDASGTRRVAMTLAGRGQPFEFRQEPGERHSWTMARTGLPYGLAFASRRIPLQGRAQGQGRAG